MSNKQYLDAVEVEKAGMPVLVKHLESIGLKVSLASEQQQINGIDLAVTRFNGLVTTAEAKFDKRANGTGNFFIEVISNTKTGKLGWAFTSKANDLYYCVWVKRAKLWTVHGLKMNVVQSMLPTWVIQYPSRLTFPGLNPGYASKGVLVPKKEIAKHRLTLFTIGEESLE